jgi:hypothetical protein
MNAVPIKFGDSLHVICLKVNGRWVLKPVAFISERYFERKYVQSICGFEMRIKSVPSVILDPVWFLFSKWRARLVAESGGESHAVQTLRAARRRSVVGSGGHPSCRRAVASSPAKNYLPIQISSNILHRLKSVRVTRTARCQPSTSGGTLDAMVRYGDVRFSRHPIFAKRLDCGFFSTAFRSWLQVDPIFADNFR